NIGHDHVRGQVPVPWEGRSGPAGSYQPGHCGPPEQPATIPKLAAWGRAIALWKCFDRSAGGRKAGRNAWMVGRLRLLLVQLRLRTFRRIDAPCDHSGACGCFQWMSQLKSHSPRNSQITPAMIERRREARRAATSSIRPRASATRLISEQ